MIDEDDITIVTISNCSNRQRKSDSDGATHENGCVGLKCCDGDVCAFVVEQSNSLGLDALVLVVSNLSE
jgi:hypothetical protein